MSGILQFLLPSIYLICSIKYILCFNDFCHVYLNYTNLFIVIIYVKVAWTRLMEFATRKTAFANANIEICTCNNLMFYVQWYVKLFELDSHIYYKLSIIHIVNFWKWYDWQIIEHTMQPILTMKMWLKQMLNIWKT